MWCWGNETRDLTKYILDQSDDAWKFDTYIAIHKTSRVGIWLGNGRFFVDVYDRDDFHSKKEVGFSLVQKWKIYRKLNKLKQKALKRQAAGGHDTVAELYLAKMVEGTLTNEKVK